MAETTAPGGAHRGGARPGRAGGDRKAARPAAPEFSRARRVTEIAKTGGGDYSEKATEAERAKLAERFGVVAVRRISYTAKISPWRDGWRVAGTARALITQRCVVTLADVDQEIEEPMERRFSPTATEPDIEGEIDPEAEDPPEFLGDSIDLGEIAAETVALAIDPWPRAPGAELPVDGAAPEGVEPMTDAETRPFAGLAALRDKLGSSDG